MRVTIICKPFLQIYRPLFVFLLLLFLPLQLMASNAPCNDSLEYLKTRYQSDPITRNAYALVYQGLTDLPTGYSYRGSRVNPWKAAGSGEGIYRMMSDMFKKWCADLPLIEGNSDNALDPVLFFAWLYYKNPAGQSFVQGRDPSRPGSRLETGAEFLARWNREYLQYMNSPESARLVGEWIADPLIEIDDYEKSRAADYQSWNEFFARNLRSDEDGNYPTRPVTLPGRDYVIVSPTDCIMNPLVQVVKFGGSYKREYMDNPLRLNTVLDVKHIPISVNDLLGTAPEEIKKQFVDGSGLACVLMPNTYHHFHSPVDGTVIHAEIVKTGTPGTPGTFGYPDFPNWVPIGGNVGSAGTDYSQFQAFQRGVIIIRVNYRNLPGKQPEMLTGYVASIPVGLDSVGSIALNTCDSKLTDHVNCFNIGGTVTKGKTKFGNFFFGGSLNILLFSKGMVSPAVQTRMGNQIGVINIGESPKSHWSMD